jgi:hypothetical protein
MIFLLLICLAFLLLRIQDEIHGSEVEESATASCPSCDKEISFDWMVCPHCLQRLHENCASCQQRKLISHSFCPSCGCGAGVMK